MTPSFGSSATKRKSTMNIAYMKAYGEVKKFWALACNHDRINPEAKFVVLSENNPHKKNYEQSMQRLLALRLELQTQ